MLQKTEEKLPVLVVDLDGTLLRSDMLFETFWGGCSSSWRTPFIAIASLTRGRAALKHSLAGLGGCEVEALPYNQQVLAYIRRWRSVGGRTALVTAANQALAEKIAAHLSIFDEVHGSNETINLKGVRKGEFLQRHFGERGFAYMGDSRADLPVWEKASKAITVDLPRRSRARVEALGCEVEHITSGTVTAAFYLKMLRPHQWLKNLLIFLPMLAAHRFTAEAALQSLLAFLAFCFVASSTYVLNDLLDLTSDRLHARKRHRPLASGNIPLSHGTWLAPLLLICGLALALFLSYGFTLAVLGYYAATICYSFYLKRHLIIDICTLAVLYTARILAGGQATNIPLSVWLIAFSIFFFFALAAVKRQAELVDGLATGKTGAHGRGYRVDDLPIVTNIALSSGYLSVLVLALYLNSPTVANLYTSPPVLWGSCLVLLYWLSRMVMVSHRGKMHDDPIVYAAKDRVSHICFLLILTFALGAAVL